MLFFQIGFVARIMSIFSIGMSYFSIYHVKLQVNQVSKMYTFKKNIDYKCNRFWGRRFIISKFKEMMYESEIIKFSNGKERNLSTLQLIKDQIERN